MVDTRLFVETGCTSAIFLPTGFFVAGVRSVQTSVAYPISSPHRSFPDYLLAFCYYLRCVIHSCQEDAFALYNSDRTASLKM